MNCRRKKRKKEKSLIIKEQKETPITFNIFTGGRNTAKEGNWYPVPKKEDYEDNE